MRTLHTAAAIVCITCLYLPGSAQQGAAPSVKAEAPPATAMAKPEPVLQHIPADALGYVVVNDVAGLTGKVDVYLETIGLKDMLAAQMPGGALEAVKGLTMLGEGLNPSGGFAVVLLDPNKFGVDILAFMERGPASQPQVGEQKLPIAILVPGTSIQGVFGNYPIEQVGKYAQVGLRMGKMLATQAGGYVVLSPSEACLDAIGGQGPMAPSALSVQQAGLIARSDIALVVNMSAAAPHVQALMAKSLENMGRSGAPSFIQALMSAYLEPYQEMLAQVSGYVVGGRLGQTGMVLEVLADFKPDSFWGQTIASWKAPKEPLLNRLPNISYVLAMGGPVQVQSGQQNPYKPMTLQFVDKLLAAAPPKLDDQIKQDIRTWIADWMDQVTGVELVGGGAPPDSGLFGVSCVLACNDSAKVKDLLMRMPALVERVIKAGTEEETMEFQFIVAAGADTIDGVSVDSVEIAPPARSTPDEDDKARITRTMGEEHIRFYVAPVDAHTVVVTFGGAKPFLAEAIKTAKAGSGQILSDPATATVLQEMPKNPVFIFLLNVGNGMEVLTHAATVMSGPQAAPPFQITTKTPIAVGSGVEGSSIRAVYYIPNDLVRECVGIAKMFFIPHPTTMQAPTTAPHGEEGF